jgi:hypothetical protein
MFSPLCYVRELRSLRSFWPTGESGGTRFFPPHFGQALWTLASRHTEYMIPGTMKQTHRSSSIQKLPGVLDCGATRLPQVVHTISFLATQTPFCYVCNVAFAHIQARRSTKLTIPPRRDLTSLETWDASIETPVSLELARNSALLMLRLVSCAKRH